MKQSSNLSQAIYFRTKLCLSPILYPLGCSRTTQTSRDCGFLAGCPSEPARGLNTLNLSFGHFSIDFIFFLIHKLCFCASCLLFQLFGLNSACPDQFLSLVSKYLANMRVLWAICDTSNCYASNPAHGTSPSYSSSTERLPSLSHICTSNDPKSPRETGVRLKPPRKPIKHF